MALTLICFSITGFSNLFASESNEIKFVYHPSNSKANWFRMIANLIILVITQTGNTISRVIEAIEFIKA